MLGNLLQLIIPLTDFPKNIMDGCRTQFFGQTFSRSLTSLKNNLRITHRCKIDETELRCSLCGHYMIKIPRFYSCFERSQMYNVDFTKYFFPYNCNACSFGSNTTTSMDKHQCKCNPHHTAFPSSDPNLTPPHRVFQGVTPTLTDSASLLAIS